MTEETCLQVLFEGRFDFVNHGGLAIVYRDAVNYCCGGKVSTSARQPSNFCAASTRRRTPGC